ncbi:Putative AC transposase [Linum perenne]
MNRVKFQLLQAIVRNLLAVSVTSLASEYSFSAGSRLLDPHRSRLHYTTVKSMTCTKSWVHDELKIGILDKLFSSFNYFIWLYATIV